MAPRRRVEGRLFLAWRAGQECPGGHACSPVVITQCGAHGSEQWHGHRQGLFSQPCTSQGCLHTGDHFGGRRKKMRKLQAADIQSDSEMTHTLFTDLRRICFTLFFFCVRKRNRSIQRSCIDDSPPVYRTFSRGFCSTRCGADIPSFLLSLSQM